MAEKLDEGSIAYVSMMIAGFPLLFFAVLLVVGGPREVLGSALAMAEEYNKAYTDAVMSDTSEDERVDDNDD
jgi:hypothetical protein